MAFQWLKILPLIVVLATLGHGQAFGGLAAVSSEVNPRHGYPVWYQDTHGRALALCLDGPADGLGPPCMFDPPDPFNEESAALGVGGESFYWSAEAAITGIGGDSGASALLELALEAGFQRPGRPELGQQIVFGRVRVRIDVPAGAGGTWIVDHPFGQLAIDHVVPGVRAVDFTHDVGCTAPCSFTAALGSAIGPFLGALDPAPPPGFIGDGVTPSTIEPGPNGSAFRIRGPAGSGIDLQTNLFVVQGKLFDGILPVPVHVSRANYSRAESGTVKVFASSTSTASLTLSGGPNLGGPHPMTGDGLGSFFAAVRVADSSVLPVLVSVKAVDPPLAESEAVRPLSDTVEISSAVYNLATQILTIEASSSDRFPSGPSLNETTFGPLAGGRLIVPGVAVPPRSVTVISSAGGMDTRPVTLASEILTITSVEFGRFSGRWTVTGTSSLHDPENSIVLHLGDLAGPEIGTAEVDEAGNWVFDRKRTPRGLRPPRSGGRIAVESSFGSTASSPVPFP